MAKDNTISRTDAKLNRWGIAVFEKGAVYQRPSKQSKGMYVLYMVLRINQDTGYATFMRLDKNGNLIGPKIARKITKAKWFPTEMCVLDKKNGISIRAYDRRL